MSPPTALKASLLSGGPRGKPRGAPGGGAAAGSQRSRPDAPLLPGNLLSSLMGSSEQEGEDSQDDGSPIELD